jgi:hypothetical protein
LFQFFSGDHIPGREARLMAVNNLTGYYDFHLAKIIARTQPTQFIGQCLIFTRRRQADLGPRITFGVAFAPG